MIYTDITDMWPKLTDSYAARASSTAKISSFLTFWMLIYIGAILGIVTYFKYSSSRRTYNEQTVRTNEETLRDYLNNEITWHNDMDTSLIQHDIKEINKQGSFNINEDALIFFHIPKTGGTIFGWNLVKSLQLIIPCECDVQKEWGCCKCKNKNGENWMFSPVTHAWPCGVHPQWLDHASCMKDIVKKETGVPKTLYHITMLRDPIDRYISEWRMQRMCTHDWLNGTTVDPITLDEFIRCPDSSAINRQTRMLADIDQSLVKEMDDAYILERAKDTLNKMAFFGILEYQLYTQILFENTFRIKFKHSLVQLDAYQMNLLPQQEDEIIKQNSLDIELYQYAKDLMFRKVFASFGVEGPLYKDEDLDHLKMLIHNKK
ncbi:unnamed protein product [Owenia fusiformis]|uniref:Heparan-sulfate 6-O-sulfotransferase n=1 Tax=Owenia fusiformis TaxID=6347 RepID=A0A8J1UA42_OWEFU|nr:unnamed protein product [Owenia fusiformis]